MLITTASIDRREVIDITDQIESNLEGSGLVNVFAKHTTVALTIADLDPGTDLDLLKAIESITPRLDWNHPHDPAHFPDHLWSSLISPSISLPFDDGKLTLGIWQRLIMIELNGPKQRDLELTVFHT
jgi:secondary thiamine-phosphate synthase enzyme